MNIISWIWRWLAGAAAACCAILLSGMALAAPVHAPSSARRSALAAATPACQTPGLVIWLDTQANGAAGSVFRKLRFTNLSGHSCTLNGFPFIHAVNLSGHVVGRRAAFTSATPHKVTLKEDKTVKAELQFVDIGNFPASKCKPTTAAGLEVFPPNQTRPKVIPFPFGACSNKKGPTFLRVAPVTK